MIVRFKKTNPQAVLPFKNYNSDFCYDCVATSREEIYPVYISTASALRYKSSAMRVSHPTHALHSIFVLVRAYTNRV